LKKYYVLDTNVLLHDVGSLFAFEDNDVIIPIVAIEELDRFKKDLNEIGRNARQVSRILDNLRFPSNNDKEPAILRLETHRVELRAGKNIELQRNFQFQQLNTLIGDLMNV